LGVALGPIHPERIADNTSETSSNIFVGNLTWTTTEEELSQLFEPFGIVESARIATDRDTGRSHGFGFVEMPNDAEAHGAIEELHGANIGGQTLTVNEARPREDRGETRRPRW
jgi:RNA recognition motif-containing protein